MSSKLRVAVIACALAALVPATAVAKKHGHAAPSYYLALGDSLSRGAQPNPAGTTVPTNQGYANILYATEKKEIKGLKLEQLGCLGETTASMMNGGICHYSAGSQLAQAIKFIKKHKIAFVTIDIGANDVDGCAKGGAIDFTCVGNGVNSIKANVPSILKSLRKAAGPKVKIAAITYYDPFLSDYLTGPVGQTIASLSVGLSQQVNGALLSDFNAKNVKVGDVATAFGTYIPFTTTTTLPGHGTVPVAVADICKYTWMCAAAPQGPNIHANATGYKKIAGVLAGKL